MIKAEQKAIPRDMDIIEARLDSLRLLREEVSVASASTCSWVPVVAAIVEAAALAGISSSPFGR